MIRHLMALAALVALPAQAGDFSEGSQANSWGLIGEEMATFDAKVVDAVCALTGDCPPDCGAGKRQMVLVREADGKTILVTKNRQTGFQGGTWDLAPLCGQTVKVDGLLVGEDPKLASKVFQVQLISVEGGEFQKAAGFGKPWQARNPDAAGKGPWFRRDPHINARVARDGWLGLDLETDKAFLIEEYGE
ncbi:MAG: hypothetical protein AAF568_08185 [Pseudomonadota bacterium]